MHPWRQLLAVCAVTSLLAMGAMNLSLGAPHKKACKATKPAAASKAMVAAGQKVFDAKCEGCHKVGKKGGTFGPNLSSIGKVKKHTAAWMTTQVRNAKKENPKMPAFNAKSINVKQMKDLAAYLCSLK